MEDLLGGMMGGMMGGGGARRAAAGRGKAASPDLYDKQSPVLRIKKVPTPASTRIWLIHFYSPSSTTSQKLSKVMTKLATSLPSQVKVAAVNCDTTASVCTEAKALGALPIGFWLQGELISVDIDMADLSVAAIKRLVMGYLAG